MLCQCGTYCIIQYIYSFLYYIKTIYNSGVELMVDLRDIVALSFITSPIFEFMEKDVHLDGSSNVSLIHCIP